MLEAIEVIREQIADLHHINPLSVTILVLDGAVLFYADNRCYKKHLSLIKKEALSIVNNK